MRGLSRQNYICSIVSVFVFITSVVVVLLLLLLLLLCCCCCCCSIVVVIALSLLLLLSCQGLLQNLFGHLRSCICKNDWEISNFKISGNNKVKWKAIADRTKFAKTLQIPKIYTYNFFLVLLLLIIIVIKINSRQFLNAILNKKYISINKLKYSI